LVSMNQLTTEDRVRVVAALVEGCSISSTVRMTGVSKPTILRLLALLGEACKNYHDDHVRNLSCKRVQVDEIWAFCYAKNRNVPKEHEGQLGYGDVWTFTGIDADTKLMAAWIVGRRSAEFACDFMLDLESRVTGRIQLTTDGLNKYPKAVADAFGDNVDFAQLIKVYAQQRGAGEARYSPPQLTRYIKHEKCGTPVLEDISTSYVERSNLTMRMNMRRFTRLTNAFSKKLANQKHGVAIYMIHYNFCRVHQTLRVTPAMEAGLSDHVWELEELVALLD